MSRVLVVITCLLLFAACDRNTNHDKDDSVFHAVETLSQFEGAEVVEDCDSEGSLLIGYPSALRCYRLKPAIFTDWDEASEAMSDVYDSVKSAFETVGWAEVDAESFFGTNDKKMLFASEADENCSHLLEVRVTIKKPGDDAVLKISPVFEMVRSNEKICSANTGWQ